MANERKRAVGLAAFALALGAVAWPVGAQGVYKWVDAQGRTHYSERKPEAQPARALNLPAAPAGGNAPARTAEVQAASTPPAPAPVPGRPAPAPRRQALSDGQDHGTDASRCALARDVLSGAVRHRNGKPTDAYDREVAQNDVGLFCSPR